MNNNHIPLYLNFKGAGSFSPRELAVLEALLQLRKKIAEKKDKPLFKIIPNLAIASITRNKPKGLKQLMKTRALSPTQVEMYGEQILEAIETAKNIPKGQLAPLSEKKVTETQNERPGKD